MGTGNGGLGELVDVGHLRTNLQNELRTAKRTINSVTPPTTASDAPIG